MASLPLAVMLFAVASQVTAAQDPRDVVRHAVAAHAGDSTEVVERRWRRALDRDSAHRAARLGLATLARLTYRDSLSERLYRDVLAGEGADRFSGYAALGMADMAAVRSRWALADSAAEWAVAAGRAAGDAVLTGEALVARGRFQFGTAGPATALATVSEAESVLPADALSGRARARCLAVDAHLALGDPRSALQAARDGESLARGAGDEREVAACQFTVAVARAMLFDVDSTLAAYERAIASYRLARDAPGLAKILWWRGDYHRLFGELGRARRDAAEAARVGESSGSWSVAAWSRITLARIALTMSDVNAAALEIRRIEELLDRQNDAQARAVVYSLEAGVATQRGDAVSARVSHEAAAREAAAIGWINGEMGARNALMWIGIMQKDSAAAFAAADVARSMIRQPGLQGHADALSFVEGTLALHWGTPEEAERIFSARQAGGRSRGARRYVDAARLSELLVRTGRLDDAEREIVNAADELDKWRGSLGERDLRVQAFQVAADRTDPDLGVATVIAALAADGRNASAFHLAERGRARDLNDRLVRAATLDELAVERVARSARPIELDSVQRSLPDDSTALLEYVTGRGDPTTLFVITRNAVRSYALVSQDSFAMPIARLLAMLESGADHRALGGHLGRVLLEPVLADLAGTVTRLIIVPDGPLHRLPFDVLGLADGRFVVERFAVSNAPSAAVAAQLRARGRSDPARGLAIIADPRFANERRADADDASVFSAARAGERGLARLEGSSREARTVARYADMTTIRRRGDASEEWLKSAELTGYGVVHFATHALVDDAVESNSALALAPSDSDDGFVSPAELADLRLDAELVVLSACRTAGGVVVRGEGVQGLATPLIVAGARAVAATWWPIGDDAAVRLIDDFYRAMAEGRAAGDALRNAKLSAIARGAPVREWAAFTIVGDPFARPSLRSPAERSLASLYVGAGLLVILIVYGVVMMRRPRTGDGRISVGSTARTHH